MYFGTSMADFQHLTHPNYLQSLLSNFQDQRIHCKTLSGILHLEAFANSTEL
jgi:hypothetical protein